MNFSGLIPGRTSANWGFLLDPKKLCVGPQTGNSYHKNLGGTPVVFFKNQGGTSAVQNCPNLIRKMVRETRKKIRKITRKVSEMFYSPSLVA